MRVRRQVVVTNQISLAAAVVALALGHSPKHSQHHRGLCLSLWIILGGKRQIWVHQLLYGAGAFAMHGLLHALGSRVYVSALAIQAAIATALAPDADAYSLLGMLGMLLDPRRRRCSSWRRPLRTPAESPG